MSELHDKNGKFRKGNPGGPGRPKGRSYAMLYADALRDYAEMNGKTPDEIENIIVKVALKKSIDGDYQFYRDTMDRLYGKPLQETINDTNVNIKKIDKESINNLIDEEL